MSGSFRLAKIIYPQACLQQAMEAYIHYCSVHILDETEAAYSIEITPIIGTPAEANSVIREFLNFLLDVSLERHLKSS